MTRNKTTYPYYTCCSPETVEMILKYLKKLENLKNEDKLFEGNKYSISNIFLPELTRK